jgi:hypothetical protein
MQCETIALVSVQADSIQPFHREKILHYAAELRIRPWGHCSE